ncbi:uncharacterized protein LOC130069786 [Rhinichthys klamathensis goyatoka]|uniref:uncharacterized protein LOC130069786 n=1 Tax=Rhinichthys klamathensis goyatoka TaxID=3034132 RepID=UPI0024B60C75|nr:uncharacterized protein LOC130069786 [Rhinichthys klamathensis goyatoka]
MCFYVINLSRSVMEIQQRKRRRTDKPHKTVATVDQPLNIQELPPLVLREILLEVVLQDGDVAIGSLALTCRCFNSIVSMESFRREAHFRWLDSVVNWKAFSENVRNLYRVPYSLSRCLHFDTTYKDCGEGYRGRGQRGVLQGFYGSDDSPGYCGDCFYVAVEEASNGSPLSLRVFKRYPEGLGEALYRELFDFNAEPPWDPS